MVYDEMLWSKLLSILFHQINNNIDILSQKKKKLYNMRITKFYKK